MSAPLFRLKPGLRLVLASASPRRRRFMEEWGLPFSSCVPEAAEPRPLPGEEPAAYVRRAAAAKARAALELLGGPAPDRLLLAADTIVALGDALLGKPRDDGDALRMLRELSGREHHVISGVCLVAPDGGEHLFSESSGVRFHPWPDDVLRAYVRTGEPLDKAGAYAVQGQGAFLVAEVHGSWSNVVGLPVTTLAARLMELGLLLPGDGARAPAASAPEVYDPGVFS